MGVLPDAVSDCVVRIGDGMIFSITRIPDGLPPEDCPGGFPFLSFDQGGEILEIRRRDPAGLNESNCLENRDFNSRCQSLFKSCWNFFVPPLILAGKDVALYYHSHSTVCKQRSLDSLERDFERAVRFYLEENRTKGFPLVRVLNSDDVEMPTDWWVWVIGYYRSMKEPEEAKALVINLEKFHDFLPLRSLDVSEEYLRSRFPATPNYFLPSRLQPQDIVPPSLAH